MLFMNCLVGGIMIVLTIIQFTYSILEHISMNSPHSNFQDHNLERKVDSQGNVTYHNWKSDYPYNVVKDKYLCNDTKKLTAKELVCPFDNAEQIKEDFANHSEKWSGMYTMMYVWLWITESLVVIAAFLFGPCLLCTTKESLILIAPLYAALEALMTHIYMTTALLQSAFIVFDFDEYCICSPNLENTDLVYTFKNTGIWYFGFGFLFCGLYFFSFLFNAVQLQMVKENDRDKSGLYCSICFVIFIQILISIELFIELSYFIEYTTEFADRSNDYMSILVYSSLMFHLLVSYIIPIISIIHVCTETGCKCGDGEQEHENENEVRRADSIIRRSLEIPAEDIGEIELALPNPPDEPRPPRPREASYIRKQSILAGTTKTMIDLDTQSIMFCTICLEGMRPEEELLRITKCRHIFHKTCIAQWGDRNMSCPMCRTDIADIC